MASINRVTLIGRLTRDPELRYTPNGAAVINFSLASNRRFKNKEGEWTEEANFINCVAWAKTAELINEYVRKGHLLGIDGRLQSRSWEEEGTGKKRYSVDVVVENMQFLEKKSDGGSGGGDSLASVGASEPAEINLNEDIPF